MALTYKTFRGYRYRRYSVAMKLIAAGWFFTSAMIFFSGPRWLSLASAVLSAIVGCFPALLISAACSEIAENEFARLRG